MVLWDTTPVLFNGKRAVYLCSINFLRNTYKVYDVPFASHAADDTAIDGSGPVVASASGSGFRLRLRLRNKEFLTCPRYGPALLRPGPSQFSHPVFFASCLLTPARARPPPPPPPPRANAAAPNTFRTITKTLRIPTIPTRIPTARPRRRQRPGQRTLSTSRPARRAKWTS